jgi:hypothetical protein
MKTTTLGLILCLLIAAIVPATTPASAQVSVSLPLTVTPPPPPPALLPTFTAPVNQPVMINGVAYTCTGVLTFVPPVGAHVSLPPGSPGNPPPAALAALPDITGGPMIGGYQNIGRTWMRLFAPGDMVYIEGAQWGSMPGKVTFDLVPVPVLSWSDREICIQIPNPYPNHKVLIGVRRADGKFCSSMGFGIATR